MKSLRCFFFVYIFFVGAVFPRTGKAQKLTTDSLTVVIDNLVDDTTKVNVMIRLANEYFWSGKYDRALAVATDANELAKSLKFQKGEGSAMIISGQSNI